MRLSYDLYKLYAMFGMPSRASEVTPEVEPERDYTLNRNSTEFRHGATSGSSGDGAARSTKTVDRLRVVAEFVR